MNGDNVEIMYSTYKTTLVYGELKSILKGMGKPIPENDVWMAALAIESSAQLVSFDQHFSWIESLDFMKL